MKQLLKSLSKKAKKALSVLTSGKIRYVTIAVVIVIISGGSAYGYHVMLSRQLSPIQLEQQTGGADDANEIKVIVPDMSKVDSQSSQPSATPPSSTSNQGGTQPAVSKAGCNYYFDVAYNTVNTPKSNLNVGKTETIGGVNGSRKVCTDTQGNVISDVVDSQPIDKIVYYGTYTSDQALSDSKAACRKQGYYEGSTDFSDCVGREMNKRSWYYINGQWVSS